MTHLSQQQIQMLADDVLDAREQTALLQHAQNCARCGRELAFQRSLVRAVRQAPLVKPSGRFTARVMEHVDPNFKGGFVFRFLTNFGNVLAMAVVVGIIGYALTLDLPSTVTPQSHAPSDFSRIISQSYNALQQFLTTQSGQMTTSVAEKTSVKGSKVALMALVSLLILALLDRFVFRLHGRMKLKS